MERTARTLIERLGLRAHFEGGWYAASGGFGVELPAGVLAGYSGGRASASHIYYMLQRGEESRWHRLRSAERWLWHCGGRLVTTLGGTGDAPEAGEVLRLGGELAGGDSLSTLVPAGCWQTTRLVEGAFALVSCIVSPAFHIDDFKM